MSAASPSPSPSPSRSPDAQRGGLLRSLRRIGASAMDIAEVRLELLGSEAEVEKLRIGGALLLGAVGMMLLGLALLLLLVGALLIAPPPWRLPLLGLLGVLLALIGAWMLHRASTRMRGPPAGMFALSRAELRRDKQALFASKP